MWNFLRVACAALTLSMAVASGPHALAAELHPDLVEAENAFVANDLNASDAALKRRIAEDPNDVEALWRQALVSLEMAQRLTPDRSQPASLKRARKTLDMDEYTLVFDDEFIYELRKI